MCARLPQAAARPFASARCVRAVLRGGRQAIDIPREAGARKPPLLKKWPRKASFWDVLMDLAAAGEIRYLHYSYKDRADRSEEHTSELQSLRHLVCRLLLEK